jgi:hypothetical protein
VVLFGTLAWPDVPVWRFVRSTFRRLRSTTSLGTMPSPEEA